MDTLTLKIPDYIKEKLKTYSKREGKNKSEIVRIALLEYFGKDKLENQGTFYELAKDLASAFSGDDSIDLGSVDLEGVFKAVGIEGGELPERMAEINQILNALPRETADQLLTLFYNEISGSSEQ